MSKQTVIPESLEPVAEVRLDVSAFSRATLEDGVLTILIPIMDTPVFNDEFITSLQQRIGRDATDSILDKAAKAIQRGQVLAMMDRG